MMGILNKLARNKLNRSDFAIPDQRMYPIHDIAHAKAALARVAKYGDKREKQMVRDAIHKRYPEMGVV